MSGWVPMPADADDWLETVEMLQSTGRRWPRSQVVLDLRWHVDQRVPLPGVPALVRRWAWPREQVEALLLARAETPDESLESRRARAERAWRDTDTEGGRRPLLRVGQALAGRARQATGSEPGADRERTGSDRGAPPRVAADNGTETGSEPGADRERTGSDPGANARGILPPDHPTTRPPESESARATPSEPPSDPDCLAWAAARAIELDPHRRQLGGMTALPSAASRAIRGACRRGMRLEHLQAIAAWADRQDWLVRDGRNVAGWGRILGREGDEWSDRYAEARAPPGRRRRDGLDDLLAEDNHEVIDVL